MISLVRNLLRGTHILTDDVLSKVFKLLLGAVGSLWVGMPHTLQILFWCMLLDQISGMIVGGQQKKLSSTRGWIGLKKKSLMWCLIGVAHLAGEVVNIGMDFANVLGIYFVINEVLSIIENCAIAGVSVPPWLKSRLIKVQSMQDQKEDAENTLAEGADMKSGPDISDKKLA